jgi:hypothetical protein
VSLITFIRVTVLPAELASGDSLPSDAAMQPAQAAVEAPLAASEPAPKRGLKAFIRGAWTFAIAMFVEGGTYLVSNLTSINIPPGIGLAGGALLQGAIYGAKKYAKPDGLL